MARKIFIDLDDTLTDFTGTFQRRFGVQLIGLPKDAMWRMILSEAGFFADLPPPCEQAAEFFWSVSTRNPIILTAVSGPSPARVIEGKRAWVREHLGHNVLMIPAVNCAKALYMHRPGDVLVDDWGKNCAGWSNAGGIAIHHADFATTTQQFWAALQ